MRLYARGAAGAERVFSRLWARRQAAESEFRVRELSNRPD